MLRILLAAAVSLLATHALAQEWALDFKNNMNVAYVKNDDGQLQIACRDGDVLFGLVINKLSEQVGAPLTTGVSIAPDPVHNADGSTTASTNYVDDVPLTFEGDGWQASVLFSGPIAAKWAGIAKRANKTIEVALTFPNPNGGFFAYNTNEFTAKGSSARISEALAGCQ